MRKRETEREWQSEVKGWESESKRERERERERVSMKVRQ